jgi:hypothetical protein
MLVCTTWQNLIGSQDADLQLWKPCFDMHEKQVTYPIDLSQYQLYQEKLKVSIATRKEDFRQLLNSINERFNVAPPLNEKSDLTVLLEVLIRKKQFETLALCLLFKPTFDTNKIAHMLVRTFDGQITANNTFCEELLIKLHYNVPELFRCQTCQALIKKCLFMACSGITIGDYLKCGIDFSTLDWNTPIPDIPEFNHSFLFESFETLAYSLYPAILQGMNATFVSPNRIPSSAFTDKKLDGYKRTDPVSEEEVKQFLRDLVFNCNLNLEMQMQFLNGPTQSALDYCRNLANSQYLPPDNVFKVVLDEYDLAKSTTRVEEL